jgi:hypothetical protein
MMNSNRVKGSAYKIVKNANKVVYFIGKVPNFIIQQYQDLGYVVILKSNDYQVKLTA